MSKEEIQIDVSGDPGRDIFPPGRRVVIPGIRVRVSIPFRGDPELWKLRPNTWSSTVPHGDINALPDRSGGMLVLTIEQPADEPPENVKQSLDRLLSDVRFYLQNQSAQLSGENAKLQAQVRAVVAGRRERLNKHGNLSDLLGIPIQPPSVAAGVPTHYPETKTLRMPPTVAPSSLTRWDVFVSHASEDKDAFVRPLAEALQAHGLRVWYDEFTLRVGDSLRRSIDRGLSASDFGVVVISPAFLSKEWPRKELDGLVACEVDGHKVILPVWHNITATELRSHSPTLSDRLATSSSKGLSAVVEDLLKAIRVR